MDGARSADILSMERTLETTQPFPTHVGPSLTPSLGIPPSSTSETHRFRRCSTPKPPGTFEGATDHATRRIGLDCDEAGKLRNRSQTLLPPATPFTSLLDQFIDIPATLSDPRKLSTPRLQPTPRTDISSVPLDAAIGIRSLLTYLHQHLHDHFSRLQDTHTTHCCFVTFIVGPSTHPSASAVLRSHLVSAFTAPPNEDHSTLYVPTDIIHGLPPSAEWHPLLVYLTAALLFPHLSFLVITPDYQAGASSSVDSLANLLRPSGSLVNPDVLLHLPPYATFQTPDVPMEDASASAASPAVPTPSQPGLHTSRLTHLRRPSKSSPQQPRNTSPLSPYLGIVLTGLLDFHVQLFQLASHSLRSIHPSLPSITPSALLVPLSTLYPHMLTISPGERVFIRPYSDPDVDRPPQNLWLNYVATPAPSTPLCFGTIEDSLLVQTQDHPHPMFQDAIPLGSSACVYLNPGLLPPPYVKPSRVLALLSEHSGGPGALQYHFHFHASDQKVPLQDISLSTHSLPSFFHDDFLNFEDWPDASTLFPQDISSSPGKGDILTVSCPEFETMPSTAHGLTWCNGLARSPDACTSGPSLSILDWHNHTSDTTGYWECYPCHTPESAPL